MVLCISDAALATASSLCFCFSLILADIMPMGLLPLEGTVTELRILHLDKLMGPSSLSSLILLGGSEVSISTTRASMSPELEEEARGDPSTRWLIVMFDALLSWGQSPRLLVFCVRNFVLVSSSVVAAVVVVGGLSFLVEVVAAVLKPASSPASAARSSAPVIAPVVALVAAAVVAIGRGEVVVV